MQTKHSKSGKKHEHSQAGWIVFIFLLTVSISACFSFLSTTAMNHATTIAAFLILLLIVVLGILFDMIGVAVTAADEKPFHSMASKKTKGAKEALRLIRKADHVASICNDVVGDICGVISGSAAAAIAAKAIAENSSATFATLIMSAIVAGLTVGGKAIGKSLAINRATQIVHMAAMTIYYCKTVFSFGKRKKKR